MTIIRAEKLAGQNQNGFEKIDLAGYFHSTNVFGMMNDGDYLEWDLTDPAHPIINQKMTWQATDLSFARAFPTRVLGSLFGKIYDCYGYNQSPQLIVADPTLGDRGTGGEQAPAVDLLEVQTLQGYPARIDSLPDTTVYVDASFTGTLQNNVLIDMYAHYRDGITNHSINNDIWPPLSKHLNVQMQLDRAVVRDQAAHAWGFSGAQVFGNPVTIDGQQWRYGFKQENLGNNNFPFISFCGWNGAEYVRVTQVVASNIWNWVVTNWDTIKLEAQNAGITGYNSITSQTLQEASCDGVHVGSEVLGGGEGTITFNDLRIVIDSDPQCLPCSQFKTNMPQSVEITRFRRRFPSYRILGGNVEKWTLSVISGGRKKRIRQGTGQQVLLDIRPSDFGYGVLSVPTTTEKVLLHVQERDDCPVCFVKEFSVSWSLF